MDIKNRLPNSFGNDASILQIVINFVLSHCRTWSSSFRLAPALWPWSTALDSSSFRTLHVMCRNPILVVSLGSGRDGWTICTSDWNTLVCSSLLSGALLGALTSPGTLLGEVRRDPNSVEEVAHATNAG